MLMHRDISGTVQLTGSTNKTVADRYTEALPPSPYPLTHLCPTRGGGRAGLGSRHSSTRTAAAACSLLRLARAKIAVLGSVGPTLPADTASSTSPLSLHSRCPFSRDRLSPSQLPYLRPDLLSSRLTRAIGARPQDLVVEILSRGHLGTPPTGWTPHRQNPPPTAHPT